MNARAIARNVMQLVGLPLQMFRLYSVLLEHQIEMQLSAGTKEEELLVVARWIAGLAAMGDTSPQLLNFVHHYRDDVFPILLRAATEGQQATAPMGDEQWETMMRTMTGSGPRVVTDDGEEV